MIMEFRLLGPPRGALGRGIPPFWEEDSAAGGMTIATLSGRVQGVEFSPDGTRLAAGSDDGVTQEFVLDAEELVEIARSRLTRWWTQDECEQYLSSDCPLPPPSLIQP